MQFNSFAKTGLISVDRPYGRGIEERPERDQLLIENKGTEVQYCGHS